MGDKVFGGTFRVLDEGAVCLTPEADGTETCVTVYVRDSEYLAFDAGGRELAHLTPMP